MNWIFIHSMVCRPTVRLGNSSDESSGRPAKSEYQFIRL